MERVRLFCDMYVARPMQILFTYVGTLLYARALTYMS